MSIPGTTREVGLLERIADRLKKWSKGLDKHS